MDTKKTSTHNSGATTHHDVVKTTSQSSSDRLSLGWRGTSMITIGVIAVIGGLLFLLPFNRPPVDKKATGPTQPTHKTVTPDGVSVNTYGGWHRVSPETAEPVYAYDDILKGVVISVSQQPLPPNFKKDPAASVAEFAKQNSYTTKLKVGTVTAYLGTNAKGPQSVIFAKDDLLILIKSQDKISNKAWVRYIKSLK